MAPSGTVTFLFTDVVGSTRLWEAHPDRMPVMLHRHDELVRGAVEGAGGTVVKSTGDGSLAAFEDATAAVQAAADAQLALHDEPWAVDALRVRMGLHTGTSSERDGDYFGPTLNRAARLMAIGHGGQVLVSDTTRGLDATHDFVDLGVHGLRDLSRPQQVYQLVIDGLGGDFPALRSLGNVRTNLPSQPTSFIGRDGDLAQLQAMVRVHRLVTVTGTGGVGKTRIALQVAAELAPDHPDGAWLCELAAAGDDESMGAVVMGALDANHGGGSALDSITTFLRAKDALIVLDNCEHLLDAAAALVEAILATCPRVRVLATTREVLAVPGEQVFGLRSLAVTDEGGDAIELFVERARSVRPGFVVDDANAAAVTEICRRLDGIPLAIELAAARVLVMQPNDIEAMLDERFRLLTGGRRARLERHHTLRAAVDWSYSLLTDIERLVFDRLAVFAGSFDLEAATATADGDGVQRWDVVDALMTLSAKSMLALDSTPATARYQLLETMRQYGVERLADRGELDARRRAHATYFARFAQHHGRLLFTKDEIAARQRVLAEADNLRAAVTWALDADDDADLMLGLELIAGVAVLVTSARALGVGAWAERAAPRVDVADHATRLAVLGSASFNASNLRGDQVAARRYGTLAMRDGLTAGAPAAVLAAGAVAIVDMNEGHIDRAFQGLRDGIAALEAIDNTYGAVTLRTIAAIFLALGDDPTAAEVCAAAVREARALGNPTTLVTALYAEGLAHRDADPHRALRAFEESLALTAAGASDVVYGEIQEQLATVRAHLGDHLGSAHAMHAGFEHAHEVGNRLTSVTLLYYAVEPLTLLGAPELAATTVG
ncbi:MAG: transcriptional regulatory protein (LuxR-family), partial [Acidimicrobiales bacterium]|nr:transcriptional regulatory protein (LuxR-family) [Acidimicrobiales bacterium]